MDGDSEECQASELAMLGGDEGKGVFRGAPARPRPTSKLSVYVVLFGLWLMGQPITRVPAVFGPPKVEVIQLLTVQGRHR